MNISFTCLFFSVNYFEPFIWAFQPITEFIMKLELDGRVCSQMHFFLVFLSSTGNLVFWYLQPMETKPNSSFKYIIWQKQCWSKQKLNSFSLIKKREIYGKYTRVISWAIGISQGGPQVVQHQWVLNISHLFLLVSKYLLLIFCWR